MSERFPNKVLSLLHFATWSQSRDEKKLFSLLLPFHSIFIFQLNSTYDWFILQVIKLLFKKTQNKKFLSSCCCRESELKSAQSWLEIKKKLKSFNIFFFYFKLPPGVVSLSEARNYSRINRLITLYDDESKVAIISHIILLCHFIAFPIFSWHFYHFLMSQK